MDCVDNDDDCDDEREEDEVVGKIVVQVVAIANVDAFFLVVRNFGENDGLGIDVVPHSCS